MKPDKIASLREWLRVARAFDHIAESVERDFNAVLDAYAPPVAPTDAEIEAARAMLTRAREWHADNVTALDDEDDVEHKIRAEDQAEVAALDLALSDGDEHRCACGARWMVSADSEECPYLVPVEGDAVRDGGSSPEMVSYPPAEATPGDCCAGLASGLPEWREP